MTASDNWEDGAPPGFENVGDEIPPEIQLDQAARQAIVDHRESLSAAEHESAEATTAALFDLLGRAHSMRILHAFATTPDALRFGELNEELSVSPNTLSARLSEFVDAGLLDRTEYDEVPPRVEYEPTETAEALFPAFGFIGFWAETHDLD